MGNLGYHLLEEISMAKAKDNIVNVRFGELIREKRLERKMTLKTVGEKVGYSVTGYKHIEDGDREVPLGVFFELCRLFDLDVNEVEKELSK